MGDAPRYGSVPGIPAVVRKYLPYAPGYDEHPFARLNRQMAGGSEAFDCARCIDVRKLVNINELRRPDGAHLDDRSAAIVAEALERHLRDLLRNQ